MLTLETIRSIIANGEGYNTEFKTAFSQDVIISLNAFANSDGGVVVIGVDDEGQIVGVTLNSESVASWINEVRTKTEPAIIPDAYEFAIDGKTIVAMSIQEFPMKPVAVKGRYYKRVKNSNHQLRLNEISNMYLKTFNSSWDYYIDEQHSMDDISLDKIIAFSKKSVTLSAEEDPLRLLQKYELTRNGQITKAAFLLFVKDFTALTGIQAGRFKSATKIIDSVSLHSDLFTEVEQTLAFVRKYFMIEYIITGKAQREERYDYPEEAIREIVLNMIVHRDYRDSGDSIIKIFDDRIEFFNPGNLSEGLTVERLLSDAYTPKARNKLINLMFKEAGLVEKYGSGIRCIVNACEKHGQCKVEFFNEQHGFKVIVYKEKSQVTNDEQKSDDVSGGQISDQNGQKGGQINEQDGQKGGQISEQNGREGGQISEQGGRTGGQISEQDVQAGSDISESQKQVLNLIVNKPSISRGEISNILEINESAISKHINKLKQVGILERVGGTRGYWKILKTKKYDFDNV